MSTGNAIRTEFVYDAWGDVVSTSGGDDCRYQYGGKQGYYTDPGTGLLKLGARYYDPTIGRFITKDPARDGVNWYAYCYDNPVGAVDPTGLGSFSDWWDSVTNGYGTASDWLQNTGVKASYTQYGMVGNKIPGLSSLASWSGNKWGQYDSGKASWGSAALSSLGYGAGLTAAGFGLVEGFGFAYGCGLAAWQGATATGGTIMLGYSEVINKALATGSTAGYLNIPSWSYSWTANQAYILSGSLTNKTFQFLSQPGTGGYLPRAYDKEVDFIYKLSNWGMGF